MSHDNENKKCLCACHINKLKKPYEHDTKCCDEMNGFIPNPPSEVSTEEKIVKLIEKYRVIYATYYQYPHPHQEDMLIEVGKLFQSVREEAKREERERIIGILKNTDKLDHHCRCEEAHFVSITRHDYDKFINLISDNKN